MSEPVPTKLAQLKYVLDTNGSRFEIVGPLELQLAISLATRQPPVSEVDVLRFNANIYDVYKHWYVVCGVTGEHVCLADLHYWDVEKQIPFKDVETAVEYASTTFALGKDHR